MSDIRAIIATIIVWKYWEVEERLLITDCGNSSHLAALTLNHACNPVVAAKL